MATHTTTSFQLNSPVPIDTRLVVGGTNSFYLDKDDITHKYDGLRVWDLAGSSPGNPGTPYVYYDGVWEIEGSSGISGTGTAGHLPKFIGSGSFVTNSIITENSSNIGIGFSLTDTLSAKLHINGTVKSEGNGFYGKGSNITNINASNISSGILSLHRLENGSVGQVLTAGASSPIWKDMENVIDITYNALKALKTNNTLSPGVRYYITDRDIWIDALDTDKLAMECKRHFRIVKNEHYTPHTVGSNNYLGVYGQTYDRGSTPNSGGAFYFAIWGGRMWFRNSSGSDVPGYSNKIISGGWTLQPITSNTYYESKIFDIKYNFDGDIIWEQSDDRGNKIKRLNSSISYIDITDWGNTNIYNNENQGIYNNFRNAVTKALINNNSNSGYIQNNSNSGVIDNNSNIGSIYNNSNNGSINNNSNSGYINNNSNSGTIYNNSNSGYINNNSNSGYINNNSNSGAIDNNSNNGPIYDNSNIGNIVSNSNIGFIYNNSNSGYINNNSNSGHIHSNSNIGFIYNNSNNGFIQDNGNNGYIQNNTSSASTSFNIRNNINNGYIMRNNSTGNIYIQYNTNNSHIGPYSGSANRSTNVQDAQVHK